MLINDAAPAVKPRTRRAPRGAVPRETVRRGDAVVPAGKLIALLDGSEGLSTAEPANATSGKPNQILTLSRQLEQADQIRRTGCAAGGGGI